MTIDIIKNIDVLPGLGFGEPQQVTATMPPVGGTESYPIGLCGRNPARPVETLLKLASQGESPQDSTVQIVRTIVLEITVELARHPVWFSDRDFHRCAKSIRHMLHVLGSSVDEQGHMKYWLDRYMALGAFRDKNAYPAPPVEFSVCPFSGFLRRFVNRRIARRDKSCLYSLQKGCKQGWPRLGPSFEARAFEKHERLICNTLPELTPDAQDSISRASSRVFRGGLQRYTKFLPTGKSCDNGPLYSRPYGGTRAWVSPPQVRVGVFAKKLRDPSGNKNILSDSTATPLMRGLDDLSRSLDKSFLFQLVGLQDHRLQEFRKTERRLAREVLSSGPASIRHVSVVSVAEPAKFRLITKMDGNLANLLQPLQGALLDAWKATPFSTMRDEDLTGKLQRMYDKHIELATGFGGFASGDYSSATDTLPLHASQLALSGMEGTPWYTWGSSSLLGSEVFYPNVWDGKTLLRKGGRKRQVSGQLMGHPLSFPLLCVINLSTYLLAIHRWVEVAWGSVDYERRMGLASDLEQLVIVNGDDILFLADDELYQIWVQCTKEHCFFPSAGKNYFSSDTAQINSQLFSLRGRTVVRVGYLSQKIVSGVALNKDGQAGPVECCRDLNRMIRLSPRYAPVVPVALSRFPTRFGALRPNWYFPACLGGFGLLPLPGIKIKSDTLQRRFAAQFTETSCNLYAQKHSGLQGVLVPRHSRPIVGDYCPTSIESWEAACPLNDKLTLLSLWKRFDAATLQLDADRPEKRQRYFSIRRRLHPMDHENIMAYHAARECFSSPPLPSLSGVEFLPLCARDGSVRIR